MYLIASAACVHVYYIIIIIIIIINIIVTQLVTQYMSIKIIS